MEIDSIRFHTALTILEAHISRNGMCREYMKYNSRLAVEYADIFLEELNKKKPKNDDGCQLQQLSHE